MHLAADKDWNCFGDAERLTDDGPNLFGRGVKPFSKVLVFDIEVRPLALWPMLQSRL